MRKPGLYFQTASPERHALFREIIDQLDTGLGPIAWHDLVNGCFPETDQRAVKNIVNELVAFGALRKTGDYQKHHDTRTLQITPLGYAWLDEILLPLPDDVTDFDWTATPGE